MKRIQEHSPNWMSKSENLMQMCSCRSQGVIITWRISLIPRWDIDVPFPRSRLNLSRNAQSEWARCLTQRPPRTIVYSLPAQNSNFRVTSVGVVRDNTSNQPTPWFIFQWLKFKAQLISPYTIGREQITIGVRMSHERAPASADA